MPLLLSLSLSVAFDSPSLFPALLLDVVFPVMIPLPHSPCRVPTPSTLPSRSVRRRKRKKSVFLTSFRALDSDVAVKRGVACAWGFIQVSIPLFTPFFSPPLCTCFTTPLPSTDADWTGVVHSDDWLLDDAMECIAGEELSEEKEEDAFEAATSHSLLSDAFLFPEPNKARSMMRYFVFERRRREYVAK